VENHSQFGGKEGTTGLSCTEFDALLTDALDGVLGAASQQRFDAHRQQCATCGPLFREAEAGMSWLHTLEEASPPANLVHNILAATTIQTSAAIAAAPKLGWKQRLSEVWADVLAPFRALVAQPRMAMTGAMALFSVSLSLNLAGVKLGDLRHMDLRPSALREQVTMKYYETTSRVVKYYENIRLVYEVESRLQELKRATTSEPEPEKRSTDRNKTENNKQDKERKQNYFSMFPQHVQLAKWSTNELNLCSNFEPGFTAQECACEVRVPSNAHFAVSVLSQGLQQSYESARSLHA
jgi:putative zinc finger protein